MNTLNYRQWDGSKYSGMVEEIFYAPNTGKGTLSGWCDKARAVFGALRVMKHESDTAYQNAKQELNKQALDRYYDQLQSDHQIVVDIAQARLRESLEDYLESKTQAYRRAMKAPDADTVHLLQLLNMRKHLSAAEIAAVVPLCSKNLQALALLGEFADRHNVAFPKVNSDFPATANAIREVAERYIRVLEGDLDKLSDMSYEAFEFFNIDGNYNNGKMKQFIDGDKNNHRMGSIDGAAFLEVDVNDIQPKSNGKMIAEDVVQ